MADKLYTEREVILRERAAYANALRSFTSLSDYDSKKLATRAFPLPKITRRKILRFGNTRNCQVRVREDASLPYPFEFRYGEEDPWMVDNTHRDDAIPGTVYGDLLLNPDEIVPDTGDDE